MAEFEVTGVRYRMGDGLTEKESTPLAEAFLKDLKVGTPVTLLADGTNPVDRTTTMDDVKRRYREATAMRLSGLRLRLAPRP